MDDQEKQPDLLRWEPGMELSTEEEYHTATAWLAKELLRDNTPEQLAIIAAQHVIFADAIKARPKELEARPEAFKHSSDVPRGLSRSTNEQLRREALAKEELTSESLGEFGAHCAKIVLDAWRAKTAKKRMKGLDLIGQKKDGITNRAREIATELWSNDTKGLRIGDMADEVYRALTTEGFTKSPEGLPDTVGTVGDWIKPVAPNYARKGGRSRKTS